MGNHALWFRQSLLTILNMEIFGLYNFWTISCWKLLIYAAPRNLFINVGHFRIAFIGLKECFKLEVSVLQSTFLFNADSFSIPFIELQDIVPCWIQGRKCSRISFCLCWAFSSFICTVVGPSHVENQLRQGTFVIVLTILIFRT